MKKEIITVQDSPIPKGIPISPAVKVGNFVFLSGTAGVNPKTHKIDGKTIEAQTSQALRNCDSVLKAAGASLKDVASVIVLLKNPNHFDRMNREYAKFFPNDPPARTVARLGGKLPNLLVSIMMTAIITNNSAGA
jgi:2-iminobutanoate/2-iminopropanoate deaminase